jgi:hypothetical protein
MIHKGDIPSVQCKISLRGPKSVRKLDGLSLNNFYVPVLTQHLSSTKTLLQLPENITLFAVYRMYTGVISKETYIDTSCLGCIIYIYILYSVRSQDSDWLWAGRLRGQSSSPGRVKNFLLSMSSRLAVWSTQPPIQWVPGLFPQGGKRPGREADHSLPASAEVKKIWMYTSTPLYTFIA